MRKRTPFLLPLFALLLLGTGCALSSAENRRTITQGMENASQDLLVFSEPEESVLGEEDADESVPSFAAQTTEREEERVVEMQTNDFSFSPSTITASPQEEITILFSKNTGDHTFVMDELDIHEVIAPMKSIIITAPSVPGRYLFYSDIGANRTLGMEGTLIVQ